MVNSLTGVTSERINEVVEDPLKAHSEEAVVVKKSGAPLELKEVGL